MGFFDKRSRQYRRKMKDLQTELKSAEREGKYIREEGLFFAELEEMGDSTMMFFSAEDLASATEDKVIRAFFDRNGFDVQRLKFDKEVKNVLDVEIIPPKEVVMAIGRDLKGSGFRMVDDSSRERQPDLNNMIFPLSAVIRMTIIHFCRQVRQVVVSTSIKANKEGNRLLKWLPRISEHLAEKTGPEVIDLGQEAFVNAYERFFGHVLGEDGKPIRPDKSTSEKLAERRATLEQQAIDDRELQSAGASANTPIHTPSGSTVAPTVEMPSMTPPPKAADNKKPAGPEVGSDKDYFSGVAKGTASGFTPTKPVVAFDVDEDGNVVQNDPPPAPAVERSAAKSDDILAGLPGGSSGSSSPKPAPAPTKPAASTPAPKEAFADGPATKSEIIGDQAWLLKVANTQAAMYKELVKAQPARCVRNAGRLLEHMHNLFETTATCLMVKPPGSDALTIYAQAGKKLSWGDGGGDGYPVSQSIVARCVNEKAVVSSGEEGDADPSASMIMHNIEVAAAVPIEVEGDIQGVLYLDRRSSFKAFTSEDLSALESIAAPFRDFPDLTLGVVV